MLKTVTAAEAKAHLSTLMAEAAHTGRRILITRRGKPMAALVSVSDVERFEREEPGAERPRGALALLGAWKELEDEEIDALVADIYEARSRDTGRPVEIEP
ncbi:MAG: type II toxin-antitoxin system Phd/YefM family antitoxin [SAR202 cluster bacterium]|nr:type II toxin-antitoxin system Phd/YefM family antitoxin [SAR202 cluster bacterium]